MKRLFKSMMLSSTAAIGLMLVAPLGSFALGTKVTTTDPTSYFCTNVASKTATISSKRTGLSDKVTQAWTQRDQKLSNGWQQVDQNVTTDRQQADTKQASNFTKLEAKATTDSEKQAVQTYESSIKSAVTIRRSAYDSARQTFRTGVQAAISTRRAVVTTQLDAFQSSVNVAINTAETSCSATPADGPAIRLSFQSSLKTDRVTFQSDRKNDSTIGSQVKQLAATRDAAFKTANLVFPTTLQNAHLTLQQAFGKSSI